MQIQMIAKEFSVTPSLSHYLDRRLQAGFSSTRAKIMGVAVRLRDLNGPRGGRDMMCQISVSIAGGPEIVVKEVQENLYTAIDQAVKRAAYRVTQILNRRRMAMRGLLRSVTKRERAEWFAVPDESLVLQAV